MNAITYSYCLLLVLWYPDSSLAVSADEENVYKSKIKEIGNLKDLRPVKNHYETVKVAFKLSLVRIEKVDRENRLMEGIYWPRVIWTDNSITWLKSDHHDLESLRVPVHYIWSPDILLYNSADDASSEVRTKSLVTIDNNGTVKWVPRFVARSTCSTVSGGWDKLDWTCTLKFGSWAYTVKELYIDIEDNPEINVRNYVGNSKWTNVRPGPAKVENITYPCCEDAFSEATFTVLFTSSKSDASRLVSLFTLPFLAAAFLKISIL